ncbi:MAG: B12-binding domain-containing radical SAM protein [Proteobacteria bacterium]|nr:B12-binding domain-containing radical SAM protein [Pseudomonadota bacterium]MBU1715788.1 B12-binding domain-containing radical SAM protein [Pseudomonadota bacterium]
MKDMKILFINPCLRKKSAYKMLPVGLAYIMTVVHEHGYDFDLLDIDINEYSDEYVENFLKENQYDVVAYGSIVTHYKWIKWLTHAVRRVQPKAKIVVGNSVAGSCYEVFLANAPADVVVIGEGEYVCLDVFNAIASGTSLSGVEGIAFRDDNGEIVKTAKRKACAINDLPMINWEFFDVPRYLETSRGKLAFGVDDDNSLAMPVATARGCINKCTFCHYVFWDDPYRFRSPEKILAEVRRNMESYGASFINFWDDLSFAALPQVEMMVEAILESGLQFKWSAAIRTDLLGDPSKPYERRLAVARKMKEAGCTTVGFSLESGNREILAMMKKRVKIEYFAEQIRVLKEVGIASNVSVIFGYPIETRETIWETVNMCLENGVYPSMGYLLPLPYTEMYRYARENGYIPDEDKFLTSITERQDICLNMTQMSDAEISAEIKKAAQRANEVLHLGLDEGKLLKTGGYKRHTNKEEQLKKEKRMIDPDNLERNENDFSFNYSQVSFGEK